MNAPTPHDSDNATTAQSLAPETHPRADAKKLRIGELRRAVDSLNWNRHDLSGATRAEFICMDVRTRLQRHIDIVQGMLAAVPARFGEDVRHARESIGSAADSIVRWQALRDAHAAEPRALETSIAYLPLPVRCAIESLGKVPRTSRRGRGSIRC